MRQRAREAIALRLKLLYAVGKHFAKSLAGHDGAGSVEIVLPQVPQCPQHLCAGLSNLQICVVYGVDELGATVRATMQEAWATSAQCTSQVNSMHSRLKHLMDRIRKVSTKHL